MHAFSLGLVAIALGLASGCEPRIEEPNPPPRHTAAAPESGEAAASTGPSAAAAGKCIRPTPAEPARQIAGPVPDPRCPKDDLAKPPKLRTGKVVFTDAKDLPVTVEITDDDASRQRGLMYRKSMADDHGMIFAFDEPSNHQFWMHNTCIPLDMLFVDAGGTIVGIEENAHTLDDSIYEVGCPSSYVIEVNAGFTRKHGIKAGQKVRLEGIR